MNGGQSGAEGRSGCSKLQGSKARAGSLHSKQVSYLSPGPTETKEPVCFLEVPGSAEAEQDEWLAPSRTFP